jgi:integrase
MRAKLTPAVVKAATGEKKPVFIWDTSLPGFGLRVTAAGHRSWPVQYKQHGVSRRRNLPGVLDLSAARKEAKAILGEAARGLDPIGAQRQKAKEAANTLEAVAREYFGRDGKKLRSIERQVRDWERLVFPRLGKRPIAEIKRSEIVRLLDQIEDERGAHMAHLAKGYLSRVCSWYANRDDDFLSPMRRGMGRIRASEHARERTLEDGELVALWRAAEADTGPFGPYVRFLLLTAVRRTEAVRMTWDEMDATGDWIIPAARMKGGKEHVVPLSAAARALLDGIPRIGPYVFTVNGKVPAAGYGWRKARLDAVSGVTNYRLHDLRRTSRSLMSRAGVADEHAEQVLAHKLPGVLGVYNRYAYHKEKKRALEALAAQIERIVNPVENVVPIAPIRRQS